jgi:deoxyribonuclease V
VTHRPLLGEGAWPEDTVGATSPIRLDTEPVAVWLRVRRGVRPLVVHPGWRTGIDTAVDIVRAMCTRARTPEPLRRAREAARRARSAQIRAVRAPR